MATQVIGTGGENKNTGCIKTNVTPAALVASIGYNQNIVFAGGLNVNNNFNFITGGNLSAVNDQMKLSDVTIGNQIGRDSILDKRIDTYLGTVVPLFSGLSCSIVYDWTTNGGALDTSGTFHDIQDLDLVTINYNADVSTYTWRKPLAATTGAYS